MALTLRGGGIKSLPLRYNNFFNAIKNSPKNVATKLEGVGGWVKALVAGPLKKELFFGFPCEVYLFTELKQKCSERWQNKNFVFSFFKGAS